MSGKVPKLSIAFESDTFGWRFEEDQYVSLTRALYRFYSAIQATPVGLEVMDVRFCANKDFEGKPTGYMKVSVIVKGLSAPLFSGQQNLKDFETSFFVVGITSAVSKRSKCFRVCSFEEVVKELQENFFHHVLDGMNRLRGRLEDDQKELDESISAVSRRIRVG